MTTMTPTSPPTPTTTEPVPQLEYASPRTPRLRPAPVGLVIMSAVLAAMVAADPFALAIGFAPVRAGRDEAAGVFLRVLVGLVLLLFFYMLFKTLASLARGLVDQLAAVPAKPAPAAAITLIICGAACVIAALAVELYLVRGGSGVSVSAGLNEAVYYSNQPSLFAQCLTILTFLAGVALAAVGIWASIPRRGASGG
jgi:hypothetical protein